MSPLAHGMVVHIDNELPPMLTVKPPLPGPLAHHVVCIPSRGENLRIRTPDGLAARDVASRAGYPHVTSDDLPGSRADGGQRKPVIPVGLPRGPHKLRVEVVDPEGAVRTGQTVSCDSPGSPERRR